MTPQEYPVQTGKEKTTEEITKVWEEPGDRTRIFEDLLCRLKYLQAGFENCQRWSEKGKESIIVRAKKNLSGDLFVILDDFEHALPSIELEKNREGMQMVCGKITKILREYWPEPIVCTGENFYPDLHEAVCSEWCGKGPSTVLEGPETGYRLREKVIRLSKVKIAEHVQDVKVSGD